MKKIRMIVTSAIVLIIVSSAFAFKAKDGAFCVSDLAANTSCVIFHNIMRVSSGGILLWYQENWDGNPSTCTYCSTLARFTND